MSRRNLTAIFAIVLLGMLLVACGPIPVPSASISTPTLPEAFPPTLTSSTTPTATNPPTSIPSPTLTYTPLPPPLMEIFPQVDSGEKFVYINNGGLLTDNFISKQNCVHSGSYGLQLSYDMKGAGNGGWGVQWINTPAKHFDISGYSTLSFWVKGASGDETFQIGIKDTRGNEPKIESVTLFLVTSDWSQVAIPLTMFKGIVSTSIENMNFGFNKNHATGSICIDDISLIP